ncbi:MAG TPA: acyl-CoA dehydrogenase C-terminal domain-containing protein, partial [Steroidobacter sp.]|nr:acyl-CoA dehydrogenase C-terminal domain-containing protein [Steroidobacter sp.]
GHGYMKEWGLEQRVRDVRITRIYEGTTGIQGMDLLGRKLLGPQRPALIEFSDEMLGFCRQASGAELTAMTTRLAAAVKMWLEMTDLAADRSASDPAFVGAAAVDYLLLAGYVSVAYMFALSAQAACTKLAAGTTDEAFYRAKIQTAQFYFDKLLPRIHAHAASIGTGSESLTGMPEASFGLQV